MFNHIIVDSELLPIREAASHGDIDAMFTLADSIVRGKQTSASPEAASPIIDAMFNHPDFRNDLQRFCNTYIMRTHYMELQCDRGEISRKEYLSDSCDYLEMMIRAITAGSRQLWNLEQLQICLSWIEDSEEELAELEAG